MPAKVFSKRLQQLRLEKGVSQEKMSLELGMTKNYIYNIETCRSYPSMTQFFSICEYLKIDPYKFICFEPCYNAKEDELFDIVKDWDNEKMDRLIHIAKEMNT